jgi:xylulokinase
VAAGCGDNAATHLALDTQPGDVVVSIGTSSTVSMRTLVATRDRRGCVDIMADSRGGFIPIVAMLNGARVMTATARMLGLTLEQFDQLAQDGDPAAHGVVFTPFLDGERNPRAPRAGGRIAGLSRAAMTPETIARASVLGLACAVAGALGALARLYGEPRRIYLVGGGARSAALRQSITDLSGYLTQWPEHREHAAFGAARQAAWALSGEPPHWPALRRAEIAPATRRGWTDEVLRRYAQDRDECSLDR